MYKNVGNVDKAIRFVLGIILFLAGYFYAAGWLGIVLMILGFVLVVTGLVSRCGLYYLFGINTCQVSKNNDSE